MAEERPATAEEIQILREHVNLHITENGSGKWHIPQLMSNFNYILSFQADLFHPKDVERFMKQDDYVSRFFMHCTGNRGRLRKNQDHWNPDCASDTF